MKRYILAAGICAAIVVSLAVLYAAIWGGGDEALVVYCAHDRVYSEKVLDEFRRRTGIRVEVRYDNELTKSLGLTEAIIAEGDNPRCDVFWNNLLLGTADLAERGLLEPYKGPGYERIAAEYKDAAGRYTGFAARLRVYIINTTKMPATEDAVAAALTRPSLEPLTIARPIHGTTLSHYAVLWDILGEAGVKAWRADLLSRGFTEARSNSQTKELVATGTCAIGFTDTDDYFVAQDAGAPVAMLPIRVAGEKVICIPNTVAIVKGTRRLEQARQLVDFLLSEEVELMLADSPARQIPLGPVDETKLSDEVKQLIEWARNPYDLNDLVETRTKTLAWLKDELGG